MEAIVRELIKEMALKRPSIDDGSINEDPEYQLVVDANNLITDIDDKIKELDNSVRSVYSKRFPELTVAEPLEYMRTVRILGNDLEQAKSNDTLSQILDPKTNMLVTMTASTTRGVKLEREELDHVMSACDMAIDLNDKRSAILTFIESRMALIAPNLSIIVGPSVAAKLLSLAGGLTQLANKPACNVSIMGAPKSNINLGYASSILPPRVGVIYLCDIVQKVPKDNLKDLRKKAVNIVANKCILAARCDAKHSSPDGEQGKMFREQIERTVAKWLEPPPKKAARPLPAPIDKSRKKRGGKRVRRMKERYAMTEMRKAANRMTFGEVGDDAHQDDLGFNVGQLGKSSRIKVDEKTRTRLSKTMKKTLEKPQNLGNTTTIKRLISGTTSTITFTPMQGIEITTNDVNPTSKSGQSSKYFSSSSNFLSVKKEPDVFKAPAPK